MTSWHESTVQCTLHTAISGVTETARYLIRKLFEKLFILKSIVVQLINFNCYYLQLAKTNKTTVK